MWLGAIEMESLGRHHRFELGLGLNSSRWDLSIPLFFLWIGQHHHTFRGRQRGRPPPGPSGEEIFFCVFLDKVLSSRISISIAPSHILCGRRFHPQRTCGSSSKTRIRTTCRFPSDTNSTRPETKLAQEFVAILFSGEKELAELWTKKNQVGGERKRKKVIPLKIFLFCSINSSSTSTHRVLI